MTEIDDEWHVDASGLVNKTETFSAVHMNHSRWVIDAIIYGFQSLKSIQINFFQLPFTLPSGR